MDSILDSGTLRGIDWSSDDDLLGSIYHESDLFSDLTMKANSKRVPQQLMF